MIFGTAFEFVLTDSVQNQMVSFQFVNFCFTQRCPIDLGEEQIQEYVKDIVDGSDERICYMIAGKEVGKGGYHHIQGYAEIPNKRKCALSTVKKIMGSTEIHLEVRRGKQEQAIEYCKKDGVWFEYGKKKSQGERFDLERCKEVIDSTGDPDGIASEEGGFSKWCLYRRAFHAYKEIKEPERDWETEVILLWGEPGTGKTRWANDCGATMVEIRGNDQFVSGYSGEDIVCFDDIGPETFVRSSFLKLFDRYKYRVNIKGGDRNWKPKTVYLTTNYHPSELLLDKAMERRVNKVIMVTDFEMILDQVVG